MSSYSSQKYTLVSIQPILTDAHPSSGATSAAVDGEVLLLSSSSKDPSITVASDDSVGSDISVGSDVSESSESEAAMSDSAQSNGLLQHLEDAEVVEFEMMNRV